MRDQLKSLAAIAATTALCPAGPVLAEPTALSVSLEVLQYDCANQLQRLEACNSALRKVLLPGLNLAELDEVAGAESLASHKTSLEPWTSYSGITCMETSSFQVDLETEAPEDNRYLIKLEYEYTGEDNDVMAGSTSMNVIPGEDPLVVGTSMTELGADIDGKQQSVTSLRLVLLSAEAL